MDDMFIKSRATEHCIINLKETFTTLLYFQIKLNPNKYAFGVTSDKFLGFMVSQWEIEINF